MYAFIFSKIKDENRNTYAGILEIFLHTFLLFIYFKDHLSMSASVYFWGGVY